MKKYSLTVSWEVASTMIIEAESEEDAIERAYAASLPNDGEYVCASFTVYDEMVEEINGDTVKCS